LWLEWWLYYAARERQRAAEVLEAPLDRPLAEPDSGQEPARGLTHDREAEEQEESAFRNRKFVGR
jgi:hypothetical protein